MDKENTAIKKTQEEITESVLKKMWGEKACTRKVSIEGEKKPIEFDIYDGYAKSTNKKGKVYEKKKILSLIVTLILMCTMFVSPRRRKHRQRIGKEQAEYY